MDLSHTVSEINGTNRQKLHFFPTLRVFCAPADRVPLGIEYLPKGSKKLERCGYQMVLVEKVLR